MCQRKLYDPHQNQACGEHEILDPRFPLSNRHINSGRITQGKAAKMLALADSIPKRFRAGLRDALSKAEIFQSEPS